MTTPRARHAALSTTLRRLRREAGLSQVEAARAANLTQAKISRLENGLFTPQVDDIRRIVRAYRAPAEVRRELEQAARDLTEGQVYSRVILQRGAWRMQQRAGRIEAASTQVRAFHPVLVPGLLQTPAYAEKVFASKEISGEELDHAIAARMERRALLESDRDVVLVTTEGALRWQLGNPQLMLEQLARIKEVTYLPSVRVGIIAWSTPVDVVPQEGFDLYDTRAVIIGTETATATVTDTRDVAAYDKLFGELEAVASFGSDAGAVIARLADEYRALI